MFADGFTECMRAESDRPTRNGGWLHWTAAGAPPGGDWRDRLAAVPVRPAPPPVDHELRARGLQTILDACPLSPADYMHLAGRGLTAEQIERHGYGTLTGDRERRRQIAALVVEACGPAAFGTVPGLHRDDAGRPMIAGAAGILIPSRTADGQMQGLRIRANDTTAGGKYRWLSSPPEDYNGGCGSGAPTHVAMPAGETISTARVGVIEGEIAGNIAADRLGVPMICMPGVSTITDVVPTLHALGATDVFTACDQDTATNPHVARAEARLLDILSAAGFPVSRATWPAGHKGLDDALTAGVMPMLEPAVPDMSLCMARVAELEAQLATVARERNQYRCERDEARHTLATVVQTATNKRNLGDSGGPALILISADIHRQATTAPTPDGFYNVNPKHLADRWRDTTGEGEDRASILSEATFRRYIKQFGEAGILDVDYRKATFTVPETGHVLTIEMPWARYAGSMAAQMEAGATYHNEAQPNRGGKRERQTVAVLPATCPDCGGDVHAACRACGSVVAPVDVKLTDAECDVLLGITVLTESAPASHEQLDDSNTVTTEKMAIGAAEPSHNQLDRTMARPAERIEAARADLARRRATADAHALLAAADEATDPSELNHATTDLFTVLEASARARGRSPVPKPNAPPGHDRWDTLPPPGARP